MGTRGNGAVVVDGGKGEGGGQMLRSALALALVSGRPFVLENVRAGRDRPGLARQHVVAIEAAAAIAPGSKTEGATLGSMRVTFEPGKVEAGTYAFDVETAGSAPLVMQTILPALMLAKGTSIVQVEGGTHNPFAPTYDFLATTFAPVVSRLGPRVLVGIERRGFVPKGGGKIFARVEPAPFVPFDMTAPSRVTGRRATAVVEHLARHIAERELHVLGRRLGLMGSECVVEEATNSPSPGNYLIVELESDVVTEVVSSLGERGLRAEEVAARAAEDARRYIELGAPVGEHLADQLLLPLAIGKGGAFLTGPPTPHAISNADVIEQFLDVEIRFLPDKGDNTIVRVEQGLIARYTRVAMESSADDAAPTLPAWCGRAGELLREAASRVRVIACCTPIEARAELERLDRPGPREAPRLSYAQPPDHAALRGDLERLARLLEGEGPLGVLFADRALELAAEASLCEAAGTPELWPRARVRFAARDGFDVHADALADGWIDPGLGEILDDTAPFSDDERDARSLVSVMRRVLAARDLPFRVVASANLAALAATGHGVVQIVARRRLGERDVERTVLHEVDGHVAPRHAAERAALPLFAIGTARGVDDQEGRALAIERGAGHLDAGRRRELARRHVAARSVERRASFVETWELLEGVGTPRSAALRITARAHRGGGLAREIVYLPALLRVEAARASTPALDRVLAAGRVSVAAAEALLPHVPRRGGR